MKQSRQFYKSKQWRKKRKAILSRDNYQCQDAKRYGQFREAVTVHHIYPLEEFPELGLESWNLISLSKEHHDRMHDRKTGKMTDAGLYWQRKRRKELESWRERHPPSSAENKNDLRETGKGAVSNSADI